jgi:hypothetical protein
MRTNRAPSLITALVAAMLITISGCSTDTEFPKEPVIRYLGFDFITDTEGRLTKGILKLEFTDGDGDIGLGKGDTLPPYHYGGGNYYNFYIYLHTKQNGQYVPVEFPDTSMNFHSRIPPVDFNGAPKGIKGELEYTFDMLIMKPFLPSDTIMIRTWITDRALHNSNEIITPDIRIP